jgi:NADH-quinone oxidoreductase subunit H
MNSSRAFIALLIFPGLLYALPIGWLMLGIERKLKARFQGRIGPPLSQPFYDVVKLLAKLPVSREASDIPLLTGLPLLAIGSMLGTLALLPVGDSSALFHSGGLRLTLHLRRGRRNARGRRQHRFQRAVSHCAGCDGRFGWIDA